jgi:CheY-like chemotaxis protein
MSTTPTTERRERARPRSETARVDAIVIDDDPDSRSTLAIFLECAGIEVRAFATAREALTAILETPPDVIVTDLHLPEQSGAELARALRADPATEHVALVALTGVVDPDWEVVRHFDAYLRKPFDALLLPRLVRSLAAAAEASRHRLP